MYPVNAIAPQLAHTLHNYKRFILVAPTGSGKSTQVPRLLLEADPHTPGEIVILEPRRLATRMLAKRVAEEMASPLGKTVGYQIRFDNQTSRETRIRFVTEGILMRQLLHGDDLRSIRCLLFDEFHERNLYTDVSLALALRLQESKRPDLRIGIMSATIDAVDLAGRLEPCAVLKAEGRMFPVTTSYAGPSRHPRTGEITPVWEDAARHCQKILRESSEGDILVFMPGAFEIRKTCQALEKLREAQDVDIRSLHGELPPEVQDSALQPSNKRKIVVSTNVAETSLTIPGIRFVIDSGLARIPAFDPRRSINTLLVQSISRASADQRAGRAGRLGPGYTLRLWPERTHQHRPERDLPELLRLDLSEVLLQIAAADIPDPESLPWLDPPPSENLENARNLLVDLGAFSPQGEVTSQGRFMARLPLHPRFSALIAAASNFNCLWEACLLSALCQGRDLLLPISDSRKNTQRKEKLMDAGSDQSDFLALLAAWQWAADQKFNPDFCRQWGIHRQAALQATHLARQLFEISNATPFPPGENRTGASQQTHGAPRDLFKALLHAFPDRIAKRLNRGSNRAALVGNRRGEIRKQSTLRGVDLFLSAEIEERNKGKEVTVLLGMNSLIEPDWLKTEFPQHLHEEKTVAWDASQKRVNSLHRVLYRDLVLAETESGQPALDEAASLLTREITAGRLELKKWNQTVEQWINRVNFLASHCADYGFATIGPDERQLLLEQICHGATSYREIRDREVMPIVKSWLDASLLPFIERLAPERIKLPSGAHARVRYETDGKAIISATIQQFYDGPARFPLADGRTSALIELLAPNRRPVQITERLDTFWQNAYPAIRKELRGRYPKHEWREF